MLWLLHTWTRLRSHGCFGWMQSAEKHAPSQWQEHANNCSVTIKASVEVVLQCQIVPECGLWLLLSLWTQEVCLLLILSKLLGTHKKLRLLRVFGGVGLVHTTWTYVLRTKKRMSRQQHIPCLGGEGGRKKEKDSKKTTCVYGRGKLGNYASTEGLVIAPM